MVDLNLLKHWNLTGKDANGVRTYVPRKLTSNTEEEVEEDGFEFKQNGTFIKYFKSSTGSQASYNGRYEIEGDTVRTYFENHYLDSKFKIVELHDKVLMIK